MFSEVKGCIEMLSTRTEFDPRRSLKIMVRQSRATVRNYLGVSFNSLLDSGVFGDTVLVPLSVKT